MTIAFESVMASQLDFCELRNSLVIPNLLIFSCLLEKEIDLWMNLLINGL